MVNARQEEPKPASDITEACDRFLAKWDNMSHRERFQTFIDSGLFHEDGTVAEPYVGVFQDVDLAAMDEEERESR